MIMDRQNLLKIQQKDHEKINYKEDIGTDKNKIISKSAWADMRHCGLAIAAEADWNVRYEI